MADIKDRDGASSAVPADDFDPELADDLGAEFELRGDQLESALEQARSEAADNLETARRVQADFENYRKRVTREQVDAVKRAGERIVLEMLPLVDNMERALDHAMLEGTSGELVSGVEMVLGQMLDVLAKEGTVQVDPFGELFDATRHQAVGQREDVEVVDGTVVEVYQKGYEMHGRIIRPAMVIVSTGGPEAGE